MIKKNELPNNFPDMDEWEMYYFNRLIEEEKIEIAVPKGNDFLGLYFNLGDAHRYAIEGLKSGTIYGGQYNFIYIPDGSTEIILTKGQYSSLCIEFTPAILRRMEEEFPIIKELLKRVDLNIPVVLGNMNMLTTPEMSDAIREILVNKHDFCGQLKEVVDHSKIIDLLLSTLDHIQALFVSQLQKSEIDQIRKAHDYLLGHIAGKFSVDQVSDLVKMEKRKLEKGFKIIYRKTVYRFILDERLKQAALLLRDTTLPANEIGREVGYKMANRFSEAFKKHYGLSPSEFRKLDT